jgi:hypothetical protein
MGPDSRSQHPRRTPIIVDFEVSLPYISVRKQNLQVPMPNANERCERRVDAADLQPIKCENPKWRTT